MVRLPSVGCPAVTNPARPADGRAASRGPCAFVTTEMDINAIVGWLPRTSRGDSPTMVSANQEHSSAPRCVASFSAGERVSQACGMVMVICVLAAGYFAPDPPSHGAADEA